MYFYGKRFISYGARHFLRGICYNKIKNMNETQNLPNQSISNTPPQPGSNEGWSWGAFMFDPVFLIAIKKYKMLWWYLLMFVPFVNLIFFIAFKIYLGIKGKAIASTGVYLNEGERGGFMKGLDHAGKISFFAWLIITALMMIFWSMIASLFLGGFVGQFLKFLPAAENNSNQNTQTLSPEDLNNMPGFEEMFPDGN